MISPKMPWELANPKIAAEINPILTNPLVSGRFLNGIKLAVGNNTINHQLGSKLQGWIIIGINGVSDIYDKQAANQHPELTLILNSSAAVTINLYLF